jgi:hypothetical protein
MFMQPYGFLLRCVCWLAGVGDVAGSESQVGRVLPTFMLALANKIRYNPSSYQSAQAARKLFFDNTHLEGY